ncbi:cysteine hydrolase [Novosphingobium bradum]|uniref:Cysteine hydrolase n=1 Tax=Novosphingobium bradum TaxID=1737444 RepID=A0ABV7IKD8_9SPHN
MAFDISPLLQPGKVAVLLSEMQRNMIGDLSDRALGQVARELGIVAAAVPLVKAARAHGAPVIHCLADTSPTRFGGNTNARLFRQKRPADAPPHDPAGDTPVQDLYEPGDVLSPRVHGLNPMADNQLEKRLRNSGITTVIIAGISTNVAIPGLAMDAVNHGYQVIVARDAVSGFPREQAEGMLNNTLAMIATLATVEDIVAAWA